MFSTTINQTSKAMIYTVNHTSKQLWSPSSILHWLGCGRGGGATSPWMSCHLHLFWNSNYSGIPTLCLSVQFFQHLIFNVITQSLLSALISLNFYFSLVRHSNAILSTEILNTNFTVYYSLHLQRMMSQVKSLKRNNLFWVFIHRTPSSCNNLFCSTKYDQKFDKFPFECLQLMQQTRNFQENVGT